jgi:hypothetical protein
MAYITVVQEKAYQFFLYKIKTPIITTLSKIRSNRFAKYLVDPS